MVLSLASSATVSGGLRAVFENLLIGFEYSSLRSMTTSDTPGPLATHAVDRRRIGRQTSHQRAISLWIGFLERLHGRPEGHHPGIVYSQ
jgi:hypothetical protein